MASGPFRYRRQGEFVQVAQRAMEETGSHRPVGFDDRGHPWRVARDGRELAVVVQGRVVANQVAQFRRGLAR